MIIQTDEIDLIDNEEQLEELLSRPSQAVVELFEKLSGNIILLGVAGKIGLSLARMAKRASDAAAIPRRVIGVSRFSNRQHRDLLSEYNIETIAGDLLDPAFVKTLPQLPNVIFLAGMKFGAQGNLPLTWAMNSYVPALVADHFKASRIVAFSTGCVYPLTPVAAGGSTEADEPLAIGEYAQSCLGRERMFEYGSLTHQTPVTLIRLNYAVEMRYGVLVDIACKVRDNTPIDLTMGYFNVIWQRDVNTATLLALDSCASPARILNLTGPATLSVREVALELGRLMRKTPRFVGSEAPTALLSNAQKAQKLFGAPTVAMSDLLRWTAHWVGTHKPLLDKPTHFENRDGKY